MFRIKICGITSVEDGLAAASAGADAIGLNFYSKSPRFVEIETVQNLVSRKGDSLIFVPPLRVVAQKSGQSLEISLAEEIAAALPPQMAKVGLFVDTPAQDICQIFDRLALDLIQLHGDQPPEFVGLLGGRPTMRAFRIGGDGLAPVEKYVTRCCELSTPLAAVLFDAMVAGQYGGTGKVADWTAAKSYANSQWHSAFPLVLAGGLTPENVAEAIRTVRPEAVDVAGGVESRPGRKDANAMQRFVQAALAAFG
jgi:phosphoribosylanthranilate isomerase